MIDTIRTKVNNIEESIKYSVRDRLNSIEINITKIQADIIKLSKQLDDIKQGMNDAIEIYKKKQGI